jgi:hypothetical protein
VLPTLDSEDKVAPPVARPDREVPSLVTNPPDRHRKMRGKLNLFQAMVLRWRDMHPYVAVHMVSVAHPLEPARLKESIAERLEAAGLARIALDRRRKRFEFRPGPAALNLAVLQGGEQPGMVARAEIERQLNAAFPSEGTFTPFRFFAIDGGATFQLGLAYDHFIAGGDSIAILLERLVDGYVPGTRQTAVAWTPRRYPRTYRRLFLRDLGYCLRGLARLPSMIASCRRSLRAPCGSERPATNGFVSFRVPEGELAGLVRTAKGWRVTMNDLVLAMLLRSLAAVVPRQGGRDRNELGVASIVNLRGEFESDARDTFGLFLASLRVSHPVPAGIELERLASDVHAETDRVKREKLFLQTLVALGWSALAWRFLDASRRRRFLAKHYPIWAGVTSLNIDSLWKERPASEPPLEYMRAVPTGPLAPIALAVTTFRGAMQVGVSYRIEDVSADLAARVAEGFLAEIHALV